ncbi:MAG: hypothetical protein ACHQ4J_09025 [Candidatus Binatia bacterium]
MNAASRSAPAHAGAARDSAPLATTDRPIGARLRDLRHPSLDAKKFPESGDPDLWQARITKGWRFYFKINGDQYVMVSANEHPK